MPIIDSQVHAYEANTPKRPWHATPNWPPHVTGDEMCAAMDKVGVDGAIFISAFSLYQYDASYAVEVQKAHPDRMTIVKPVDPDDPAVADVIADWKRTPGTVGIRIVLTNEPGREREPSHPGLDRIARCAGDDRIVGRGLAGRIGPVMVIPTVHVGVAFDGLPQLRPEGFHFTGRQTFALAYFRVQLIVMRKAEPGQVVGRSVGAVAVDMRDLSRLRFEFPVEAEANATAPPALGENFGFDRSGNSHPLPDPATRRRGAAQSGVEKQLQALRAGVELLGSFFCRDFHPGMPVLVEEFLEARFDAADLFK